MLKHNTTVLTDLVTAAFLLVMATGVAAVGSETSPTAGGWSAQGTWTAVATTAISTGKKSAKTGGNTGKAEYHHPKTVGHRSPGA